MLDNIELFAQSALKIKWHNKNIYFDPFKINNNYNDADYIFITHSHYDHFSLEDILKVKKDNTKIIVTCDLIDKVKNIFNEVITVLPNREYIVDDINFKTTYAYNLNKNFHQKEFNWVGYILDLDDKIYVAGDTDYVPELNDIKCDIACVPIGGTYTMDKYEASNLIKAIKPKYVIPIHYKTIVGSKKDALEFNEILKNDTFVKIFDF